MRRAAILLVLLAGCAGPRPSVGEIAIVEPPRGTNRYEVLATVTNRGGGQGQIEVEVKLRDTHTGLTFQGTKTIELGPHEVSRVIVPVDAPHGRYAAEVEAQYPTR